MSQPKVSILVPCCNVEKYVAQCLDSLLEQTLKELEIICINDGSKDGTLAILKQYAAKDSRIVLIDKPNSGYGDSMNIGLQKAQGEYVGIVESDDWAEPHMFATLYTLAQTHQVQVVKSNFFTSTQEGDEPCYMLPLYDTERVICPRKSPGIFYCQPSIWSAIYQRSFLEKYKIDFVPSPGASYQDVGFNFKVWAMADRVWLTAQCLLHYRCGHAGQSVKSSGKVFCVRDEWNSIERFLEDYPEWKKSSYTLRNHVKLGNYRWNLDRLSGESKEAFRQCFAEEYGQAVRNGGIESSLFSNKEYLRFRLTIEPHSVYLNTLYALRNLLPSRVKKNKKVWYLFSLIPVYRQEMRWPTFTQD